ncbi:TPA: hypothetical protein ACNVU1_003314 [Klebsiella variicola]|nr:hypothetical protein [Klebsiella variicola]
MITIIFGAGASWDSEIAAMKNNGMTPPLGDYLFSKLDALNGATSRLDENTKKVFIEDGYEAGMERLPPSSGTLFPILKESACFLSSFTPSPENAYTRLFNRLKNNITKITIATLNYDMLIEKSLMDLSINMSYICEDDYNGAKVIKFHGSSNLVPVIPQGVNISGVTMTSDKGVFLETDSVEFLRGHEDIVRWCNNPRNESLCPIMCLYNKEKRVLVSKRAVNEIQEKLSHSIEQSKEIILVGVKYISHDTHLWDLVFKSQCHVVIVDPYPSDELIDILKQNGNETTIIEKGFYESVNRLAGLINSFIRKEK